MVEIEGKPNLKDNMSEQLIELENKIRELNYNVKLLERDILEAKDIIEKRKRLKKKHFLFKIPLR